MAIKFKPKFWKDINLHKNDREILSELYKVFINVEKANRSSDINGFKELR